MIAKIWYVTQEGDKYVATERLFGTRNCNDWYEGEPSGQALTADSIETLREQLQAQPYCTSPLPFRNNKPIKGVLELWA
jgi:hypothetical protein